MFIKIHLGSLLSVNYTNDLQPIDDWNGQLGLMEIDSNGDLMPISGSEEDKFLNLDSNLDIQPKA
jgi:hypothetical protein